MACIIEEYIELRKLWQKDFKVTRIRRCCEIDVIILFIHMSHKVYNIIIDDVLAFDL